MMERPPLVGWLQNRSFIDQSDERMERLHFASGATIKRDPQMERPHFAGWLQEIGTCSWLVFDGETPIRGVVTRRARTSAIFQRDWSRSSEWQDEPEAPIYLCTADASRRGWRPACRRSAPSSLRPSSTTTAAT